MPEAAKPKGVTTPGSDDVIDDDSAAAPKARPDVTQKGQDMIGDFRTDALHDALGRAPIADDMLMALLVLAFAAQNVRVDSGAGGALYGGARFGRHVARLLTEDGRLSFDMDAVRIAARATLIDVLSCRRGMSNSGVVSRLAGEAIGADGYLPNMGSEEFFACLSPTSLHLLRLRNHWPEAQRRVDLRDLLGLARCLRHASPTRLHDMLIWSERRSPRSRAMSTADISFSMPVSLSTITVTLPPVSLR